MGTKAAQATNLILPLCAYAFKFEVPLENKIKNILLIISKDGCDRYFSKLNSLKCKDTILIVLE